MPTDRHLPPGHVVTFPNREKATSKATKGIVILLLGISVALILAVTLGGWSKLQGVIWVDFLWCFVYVVIAVLVARWARGLLPIASAFAILMLILSLIAGFGGSGTSWFQRHAYGYAPAHSIFGGTGFSPDLLGVLVFAIAPVQALLIIFAMQGFSQEWNVELERHVDDIEGGPGEPGRGGAGRGHAVSPA